MKAMILCAGFGERLMPLTTELPKPAFPLANRPLVWYTLRLLRSWGVDSVIVNAHHLPDVLTETVRACLPAGMEVEFSMEKEILGTGGGLSRVRGFFRDDEPFILINGDILTDMDIAGAVELHLARGAVATMVISTNERYKLPGEVMVDSGGRIRSILGRPGGSKDLLPAFFTGLHIMSRKVFNFIPDRPRSCIIRDCYMRMVEEDRGVFGFITGSYWSDIGTPGRYLNANIDVLEGKYSPPFKLELMPGEISSQAGEGSFLVGGGCRIGRDVQTGPGAIIGEGAVIGDGCSMRESVVWPGAIVPAGSSLVRAVVARTVSLEGIKREGI